MITPYDLAPRDYGQVTIKVRQHTTVKRNRGVKTFSAEHPRVKYHRIDTDNQYTMEYKPCLT